MPTSSEFLSAINSSDQGFDSYSPVSNVLRFNTRIEGQLQQSEVGYTETELGTWRSSFTSQEDADIHIAVLWIQSNSLLFLLRNVGIEAQKTEPYEPFVASEKVCPNHSIDPRRDDTRRGNLILELGCLMRLTLESEGESSYLVYGGRALNLQEVRATVRSNGKTGYRLA
ncbi:hypothetical protein R1flu_025754 [Riccia fluitans]|uniref:Uncharacterized protein n=1 Tax=Riccia fluitans TaxID=41844 RepID=A0ABD1XYM5_9MARC